MFLQLQIQLLWWLSNCRSAIFESFLCCWLSAVVKKTLAFSLPPPNKLCVNIISSHPRPCYTQQSTNISLLLFLHQTLWVQIKYSHHVWVWTLYCGKLLDSETVLCHNYPLSASYRVLVWKMCWMGVNITDGCVCVHKSEKFGSDGRTSHSWACYSSVDRPACLDCWPVTDLHNFNSLSAKCCWH